MDTVFGDLRKNSDALNAQPLPLVRWLRLYESVIQEQLRPVVEFLQSKQVRTKMAELVSFAQKCDPALIERITSYRLGARPVVRAYDEPPDALAAAPKRKPPMGFGKPKDWQ